MTQVFFEGTPFAAPAGEDVLGPWQAGYDAWTPAENAIAQLPADHFQTTLLTQIIEVREALAANDPNHALMEMNDIISVTLNWMRSIGATDERIAHVAQQRAANRYVGQVWDILLKYMAKYDI
jgi:hypothetical protein